MGPFRRYRRGVDFETGRVWMTWEDDGGTMVRELFVSRASDTVILRIRGDGPGCVYHRLRLGRHGGATPQDGGWSSQKNLRPAVCEERVEEGGWLVFTGRFPEAYAFGVVGRTEVTGGTMRIEGDEVVVEGADELVLRVKLFVREDPEEAVPRLCRELQDGATDFEGALAEHAALHGELFNRVRLELPAEEPTSNEEMLMEAYEDTVPTALVGAMFEFGRYLLICSNRPGGWPANLQGIWNGDYTPAWNSDFHNDENIQMNYWQALPGNLPEMAMPFFDYFERCMADFRENARKLYGCRGIFVPIAQTTHGTAFPSVWTHWISAAGWLAQLFYDYYLFTGDRALLAGRAVPWLREVAQFYEDFLVEGPDGRLMFSPSISPENVPAGEGMSLLTINATMDVAICREVLNNLCQACEVLGVEQDGMVRWRAMLARLPEYDVNEDGALCEWLHPRFKDNYHHRHQSHLYPLFPGLEITEETHPELYEACRIAVEKRLVIGLTSQTGWSMAHMASIYARLGLGNRALECIELIARSSTGPNLFTYHNDWRDMGLSLTGWGKQPPFQIDANFGISAAILEMLVFSKPGLVKLLPALPDPWTQGRVCGIACRGDITVDLEWDRSKGDMHATLISQSDQEVSVKLPWEAKEVEVDSERYGMTRSDEGLVYLDVALHQAKPVQVRMQT